MDLKNNYSPLTQSIKISLFDECSKLDISYIDERFNDNYNTQPNETISISFHMDYLGFLAMSKKVMFLRKQVTSIMGIRKFTYLFLVIVFFVNLNANVIYEKNNKIITDLDIKIYKQLYKRKLWFRFK